MLQVLLKALSFVFIIFLGYGLKKIRLFGPADYKILVKVVTNMTLPAAVITSFASLDFQPSLILLCLMGFGVNCLMLLVGFLLSRGKTKGERALYALCMPGYNIGAFALPYAQGFLGAAAAGVCSLFDTGNAIMCTGGSCAVTETVLCRDGKKKPSLGALARSLLRSTPFVTYTLMLVITLCGLTVPQGIVDFISPIAAANPYAAMLMIGMMFELDPDPKKLKAAGTIVLVRNLVAVALSLVCYFLLPLPLVARQALAVLVFAPPSVLTPAFTEQCGGDGALASCVTSICILTAIVGMTTALLLF